MFHFTLFIKVQIILRNRAKIHRVNVGESPTVTRIVKTLKLAGKIRLKLKCLVNVDCQYAFKYTTENKNTRKSELLNFISSDIHCCVVYV
jgi:hypothetical protein